MLDENPALGLTVDDVLAMADLTAAAEAAGLRYELHEGALRMAPSPGFGHQRIEARLVRYFDDRGRASCHEVSVRFGSRSFRTPDVLVLRPGVVPAPTGLLAPDLFEILVEIVSPTSGDEDRIIKPKVYADAGVPEYWRIELEASGYVVYMHRLDQGQYVPARVIGFEELLREES